MVNENEVFKWISDLCGFGYRRPGTEADQRTQEYLVKMLKEFGLDEVWLEPIEFGMWDPKTVELRLSDGFVLDCEPLQYSKFTEPEGVEGEMVYIEDGTKISEYDIEGKIPVVDIRYGELSIDFLRIFSEWIYDPGNTLSTYKQPATWINEMERMVYEEAKKQDALGIVLIYPFNMRPYILSPEADPYNGRYGAVAGVVLTKNQGESLKRRLGNGVKEARLVQAGEIIKTTTSNVLAEVKGDGDKYIVMGSHHDSMWEGGTEDASGTAVILGAAKYFAKHHKDVKHSIVFLFDAAEQIDVMGSKAFIDRHKEDILKDMLVEIHMEHIAKETLVEDGEIIVTDELQPRAIFVSKKEELFNLVKRMIVKHDMRRTIMLPTDTPLGVPTDATKFAEAGYPLISFISAPLYWNTDWDTVDKVPIDEVVRTIGFAVDLARNL